MGNVPVRNIDRRPGRTNPSNRSNANDGTQPELVPYGNWLFYEYNLYEPSAPTGGDDMDTDPGTAVDPVPSKPEPTPEPVKPKEPLKVTVIDIQRKENETQHFTNQYDPEEGRPNIITRRGQPFDIILETDREYVPGHDEVRIIFEIVNYVRAGFQPLPSTYTQETLHMNKGLINRKWSCEYVGHTGTKLTVRVQAGVDALIGKWNLIAQTSLLEVPDGVEKVFQRFKHYAQVYVIFNPFSKDDETYMEDEIERDEYVMAETGHVFVGNYQNIWARPWNFGQFEENILDCAMLLLDKSGISYKVRGRAVYVARALSATANTSDDNGVLVGNWSGDYADGTSPSSWAGSVKILQEYYETRKPVMYGQCWVFSGILTTLSRAIGLPTRSVTNFASAHDTDESCTIDTYWKENGEKDDYRTSDSVWNFHVWNEAWMRRDDLPSGYDGWQAYDATPQETSDGIYQAGPAPIKAIKEGNIDLRYDAQFIFSEVNADRVNWKMVDGEWVVTTVQKSSIGLKVSTNLPRKMDRPHNPWLPSSEKFRLDVTDQYKHKEGSAEERAAVYKAHCKSVKKRDGIYDSNTKDVAFELAMKNDIMLGNNFDVVLRVQNKSREHRSVVLTMTLNSVFYTGVKKDTIKSKKFNIDLAAIKAEDAVMRITFDDYMYKITESAMFSIDIDALVSETYQNHSVQEAFRLKRPDPVVEGPEKVQLGKEFEVLVKFESTVSIPLTECEWELEGPGLTQPRKIPEKNFEPYDRREIRIKLTATKPGDRTLIVTFNSKELTDSSDELAITVEE